MSTQFLQRQDAARTNTVWLVVLFTLAVVGIIGVASAAAYIAVSSTSQARQLSGVKESLDPIQVAAIVGCVTGVVILAGSLYQILSLRAGGGTSVAESIGGRPLIADSATMEEKRLLNVVEEMAIASGIPVPPVYLLEEAGINAFAAGYRPADAVLGITRGAIENLNREQLQGVIAHEFSHILNGDMRMNIRMIGILHGILLLSLLGRMLFHSMRFSGGRSRSSDNNGNGIIVVIFVVGLSLLVIGGVGYFIGGLIKAAVSRQREYLADASAVQFTRNPNGIAGALKRIAGWAAHGQLKHPNASVASHLFFSQGVFEGLTGLLATHPPLKRRILAIEPTWDGSLGEPHAENNRTSQPISPLRAASATAASAAGFAPAPALQTVDPLVEVSSVREAAKHIGAPEEIHRIYSAELLTRLDPELRQAASEPYSARALVFALLLDRDNTIAKQQIESLREIAPEQIVLLTVRLAPIVARSPEAMRLPLVDLSLAMLRRMSESQYRDFTRAFDSLIQADNQLSIFEWTLAQVLKRNLNSQFTPARNITTHFYSLAKLGPEVSVLLSTLARVGHTRTEVENALVAATAHLRQVRPQLVPASACNFQSLEAALARLRQASAHCRRELIDACAACVAADGIVRVREAELLRGIADLLECPMPPLIEVPL
jgi:Zn-dependent protease with chaperone function/uncharacterized tellurite resistance protein B-like protein